MSVIARVFYVVSALCAVALLVWAGVLLLIGDQSGTFPGAFSLWLATGLPLLLAGIFMQGMRARRMTLSMPSHLPDGKRDLPR